MTMSTLISDGELEAFSEQNEKFNRILTEFEFVETHREDITGSNAEAIKQLLDANTDFFANFFLPTMTKTSKRKRRGVVLNQSVKDRLRDFIKSNQMIFTLINAGTSDIVKRALLDRGVNYPTLFIEFGHCPKPFPENYEADHDDHFTLAFRTHSELVANKFKIIETADALINDGLENFVIDDILKPCIGPEIQAGRLTSSAAKTNEQFTTTSITKTTSTTKTATTTDTTSTTTSATTKTESTTTTTETTTTSTTTTTTTTTTTKWVPPFTFDFAPSFVMTIPKKEGFF